MSAEKKGLASRSARLVLPDKTEGPMPASATWEAQQEGGVAAVDRALSILAAYRSEDDALTLAELAARTGIYKSTILRLIQSLMRGRLLFRLQDGRYQIGSEALRLGTLYQRAHRLGDVVLPVMHTLAERTGESVVLHVREGDARVALHRVESHQPIRYHVREGDSLPLTAGSGGHVLVAFSGAHGQISRTIRERMHHASYGERDPETSGMSAPVFGPGQSLVGALTVAGPATRVDEGFVAKHLPVLLDAVASITHDLGGNPGVFAAAREAAQTRPMAVGQKGADQK
jgi:DNA-binding IclR family transcriptional regulator